jgi:hypothetical protein
MAFAPELVLGSIIQPQPSVLTGMESAYGLDGSDRYGYRCMLPACMGRLPSDPRKDVNAFFTSPDKIK